MSNPSLSKRRGRPAGLTNQMLESRYQAILEVAREHTEVFAQTVRHIYYLCSGQGIVGKDHGSDRTNSNIVGKALLRSRWDGDLDWSRIVDGTRELSKPIFWEGAPDFLENVVPQFKLDKWAGQTSRVVLAVEKDAIAGMLEDLCREHQVPLLPFRGQLSDSTLYDLAKHITQWNCDTVQILYLGDFDPSGMSIDRAVFGNDEAEADEDEYFGKLKNMLYRFFEYKGSPRVEYTRIGIVLDDLDNPEYADFILPASRTDKNFPRFMKDTHGDDRTLGIDALDAETLIARTKMWIELFIDQDIWQSQEGRYKEELARLQALKLE